MLVKYVGKLCTSFQCADKAWEVGMVCGEWKCGGTTCYWLFFLVALCYMMWAIPNIIGFLFYVGWNSQSTGKSHLTPFEVLLVRVLSWRSSLHRGGTQKNSGCLLRPGGQEASSKTLFLTLAVSEVVWGDHELITTCTSPTKINKCFLKNAQTRSSDNFFPRTPISPFSNTSYWHLQY